ncbi:unnamed protein product [Arctogadus glacialis]
MAMKGQCEKATDSSKKKICSQIKVVFHLAKHDIPGHQYVEMKEILRAVQAPDFTTSEGRYRHSDSISDMEMALEDVVLKGLYEKIRASALCCPSALSAIDAAKAVDWVGDYYVDALSQP